MSPPPPPLADAPAGAPRRLSQCGRGLRRLSQLARGFGHRARGRRSTLLVAGAAALALLAAGAVFTFLPSRPPRDRGGVAGNAPGDDRIGPAPDGQTPDTQTPHAQTTADPQAGGGAAPIASRSAVAVVNVTPVLSPAQTAPARPALAATYRVSAMSDSDHLVEVTVANIGDSDVNGWTVIMQLSGLSLVITPGKGALYEQRWREHVFTPTAETAYVPVGASVAFSYTVTGDFASVDGCTIDGYRCG